MAFKPVRFLVSNAGPGLVVQEAMYGFIMALIFITATRFGLLGDISETELLLLILGMNVTWGAIDMIVFFFVDEGEHHQMHRFMETHDPGKYTVRELLDEDFAGTVLDSMYEVDRQRVYDIVMSSEPVPDSCYRKKTKELFMSAFVAFIVTALTIIPFALCLLLIPDMEDALLISALLASLCLFFIGFAMGPYLGKNGARFGLAVALVSLMITVIATLTGG